jgi:hypothetical protein
MKTYTFKVVVEPDDDAEGDPACLLPGARKPGCCDFGAHQREALKHINEVVQLVVDSMIEHGELLPEESTEDVQVTVEPRVTITV